VLHTYRKDDKDFLAFSCAIHLAWRAGSWTITCSLIWRSAVWSIPLSGGEYLLITVLKAMLDINTTHYLDINQVDICSAHRSDLVGNQSTINWLFNLSEMAGRE
jgi:nucleoid-associated protein YejK